MHKRQYVKEYLEKANDREVCDSCEYHGGERSVRTLVRNGAARGEAELAPPPSAPVASPAGWVSSGRSDGSVSSERSLLASSSSECAAYRRTGERVE